MLAKKNLLWEELGNHIVEAATPLSLLSQLHHYSANNDNEKGQQPY
jgi:hypothetical protein